MALSVRSKSTKAFGAATLLAVAGLLAMPGLAKAQEEQWTQTNTIPVPGLQSFDISFVETSNHVYLLADRSNQQVVNYWIGVGGGTLEQPYKGAFVGAVKTASGTVNNDLSGPNGVLAFLNPTSGNVEVWSGDGPSANAGCQAYLSGVCSAVKVFTENQTTLPPSHVIPTGGAARADEACHDGPDALVLWANDAEADFAYGTPFVSFISTATYKVVATLPIPFTTNGIEQCQYDPTSGLFFINIPEVGGTGADTADGEVLAISPTTHQIVATYIIPTPDCAGPQGMALGPEPQLLLGCNAAGPGGVRNSLIINKHTGAVIAIGWGIGGADEAWFNPTNSHYWITGSSCTAASCLSGTVQQLAVVDATGALGVDQVIVLPKIGSVSAHSVAADTTSGTQEVFSPNNGGIAVFTPSAMDSDDPSTTPWPQ